MAHRCLEEVYNREILEEGKEFVIEFKEGVCGDGSVRATSMDNCKV
jgi:hypothetical protein